MKEREMEADAKRNYEGKRGRKPSCIEVWMREWNHGHQRQTNGKVFLLLYYEPAANNTPERRSPLILSSALIYICFMMKLTQSSQSSRAQCCSLRSSGTVKKNDASDVNWTI